MAPPMAARAGSGLPDPPRQGNTAQAREGRAKREDGEGRQRGKLRIDVQPAGDFQRDGGHPDDQGRIDFDHIDIEFPSGQPAAGDVQQPGDVVLQRRQQSDRHDHADDRGQQREADDAQAGTGNPGSQKADNVDFSLLRVSGAL